MLRSSSLTCLLAAIALTGCAEDQATPRTDPPKPATAPAAKSDPAKPAGDAAAVGEAKPVVGEPKPGAEQGADPAKGDPKSVRMQASFQVGLQMGDSVKKYELDPAEVVKGIQAATSANPPTVDMQAFQALMQQYQAEMQAALAERGKGNIEKNKVWLAENGKKTGMTTTPSGLQYEVITAGAGKQPLETDTVSVNYKGYLPDGTVFDESSKHGGPATFPLHGVIKGWTEALKMMKEGDKWRIFLPSDLAYGPAGSPPTIPPNQLLIFEVELIKVLPPQQGGPQGP